MICPLPRANDLTAPSRQPGCHAHRGGGDDLHSGCSGAGRESSRGPHAGAHWTAALDSRGGGVGGERPHGATAALALRAVRVHRALRPPAAHALAAGGAAGRGAAAARPLPRPLRPPRRPPGLPRAPLLSDRPARAWAACVLLVREEGPAGGRAGEQAPAARPPSPPPRAPAVLRRAPAPGRQPASLARPRARELAD